MKAMNPYFLIKVPKEAEIEKREKQGNLYLHPSFVWMTRNTQCGEIVDISPEANRQLPEANIGDLLIVHHFSQGSHSAMERERKYLVFEDESYNYYNITSKEIPGVNNQTYGVFTEGKIVPHKDYTFLQIPQKVENEYGYKQTSDDILQKVKSIRNEVEYKSKGVNSMDKYNDLMKKQKEMAQLSASLHKKEYIPFTVAFGENLGNEVLALSMACKTEIPTILGDFIVAESKYIAAYN